MKTNSRFWIVVLVVVVLGFCIGIYLQDLKHKESTEAAWRANRFNIARFNKIRDYNLKMTPSNWRFMRDSIEQQFDSLMILRFRKEMDSIKSENK
ncbi:hypothetical protein [Maribacter polysiphoniae]|uniref:hypothetical protein n=1 Tax=Maribacter polysiphoniae TaxID=429344 RepID=UPI002352F0DC|nr:hypothetical protein [Maribacter polysiphoniae]